MIQIHYIEVFGIFCFKNIYKLDLNETNNFIFGKMSSGKTSLAKCLVFLFDENNEFQLVSTEDLLDDNAYIEIKVTINNRIITIRKNIQKKTTKTISTELDTTSWNEYDFLLYEKISICFFQNERIFDEKEYEVVSYENNIMQTFLDSAIDEINLIEEKWNNLNSMYRTKDIQLMHKFNWNKLLNVTINTKLKRNKYSSSERKIYLINLQFQRYQNEKYIIYVFDDFDMYIDSNAQRNIYEQIIWQNQTGIFLCRESINCKKYIDYRYNQNLSFQEYLNFGN